MPNARIQEADEVLTFARTELEKYYRMVTGDDLADDAAILTVDNALDARLDEYAVEAGQTIAIHGANPRAVLFGVYEYCRRGLGIGFVRPEYERIPSRAAADLPPLQFTAKADFPVRAYTPDRPADFAYPIDSLVKLGYNAYAISATNWEKQKTTMQPAMKKRGMMLAISGHDLGYYMPADKYFPLHPDWYSLYDGQRTPHQICYSSTGFAEELARVLQKFCQREDIHELVIMFNDNAFKCGCEACQKAGFMATYLGMLGRVQDALDASGMDVQIYHIAYNAALAWDMLEVIPPEADGPCMIACWGRDYRLALDEADDERSRRFQDTFARWGRHLREKNKGYAVFEYYGDQWMMGTLLPPMGRVLSRDMAYMKQVGVSRVDFLHFGFQGSLDTVDEVLADCGDSIEGHAEHNTESQVLWFNLYMAGRYMWDAHTDLTGALDEYAQLCFGEAAGAAAAFLLEAEKALAPLSRFATDMFKLRVTEPWHRDDFSAKGTGRTHIRAWSPEEDPRIAADAAQACGRAASLLAPVTDALAAASVSDAQQRENLADLLACARYLRDKTTSLQEQYQAELSLSAGDKDGAAAHLRRALELEESFDGIGIAPCRRWLAEAEKA